MRSFAGSAALAALALLACSGGAGENENAAQGEGGQEAVDARATGVGVYEAGTGRDTGTGQATGTATGTSRAAGSESPDGSPASAPTGTVATAPTGAAANAATAAAGPATAAATLGPSIGGCAIFPPDNPWNTRVDDPSKFPVHPNSATYIANMNPGTHLHADWGAWSTDKYGIPWQTVPASQPLVPMSFDYADESDPGPYPFPPNAMVEGGAGSGGDMHVLVLQTGTCTLYETWSSTFVGPGWQCGSGAKFNLESNELRPDGWTSSDAAGLPVLPGLVRLAEVQSGVIPHALRFTVANTQAAFIHPATHAAGQNSADLPPMGLRIRLKASYNVSNVIGPARVILTAMQQYGMLLADNGSAWYVTGDSDDRWTPLMDAVNQAFSALHGSDFEAVQTGPIQH
jgi:hypothetical protein